MTCSVTWTSYANWFSSPKRCSSTAPQVNFTAVQLRVARSTCTNFRHEACHEQCTSIGGGDRDGRGLPKRLSSKDPLPKTDVPKEMVISISHILLIEFTHRNNNGINFLYRQGIISWQIATQMITTVFRYWSFEFGSSSGAQASPHFLLRFTWRVLRQEGFTCVYRLCSRKTAGISE
jgi:hypothetical protein